MSTLKDFNPKRKPRRKNIGQAPKLSRQNYWTINVEYFFNSLRKDRIKAAEDKNV